MKRNIIKMIAGLLAFVLLLSGLPTQIAHASAGEELLEVISYADGSYLEITLETLPQARASGSVTKAKNYVYKNENNIEQWKITLTGSFNLHRDRLDLHGLQLRCHNLQQRLVCCFQVRNQKWKHGILFSQNGKKISGSDYS